jgi:hypothetical protein
LEPSQQRRLFADVWLFAPKRPESERLAVSVEALDEHANNSTLFRLHLRVQSFWPRGPFACVKSFVGSAIRAFCVFGAYAQHFHKLRRSRAFRDFEFVGFYF